jgi:hypothetical protein
MKEGVSLRTANQLSSLEDPDPQDMKTPAFELDLPF